MVKMNSKILADNIIEEVKEKLSNPKYKSITKPHIVTIKVGDDPLSNILLENKKKVCEELDIEFRVYEYKEDVTTDHLKKIISKLSLLPTITGISIQTPLPDHINLQELIDDIDPIKDIEGVTNVQAGMLQLGTQNKSKLVPYTAAAIYDILYSTDLKFDTVTVIGSDNYTGKTLIRRLLEENNINIISCPSSSSNIQKYTTESSVVILTSGKPESFSRRYFYGDGKKFIIDAALNVNDDGKLCGSLDLKDLKELYNSRNFTYTPVPDGIDLVLIAEFLNNICTAYDNQFDFMWNYCGNLKASSNNI